MPSKRTTKPTQPVPDSLTPDPLPNHALPAPDILTPAEQEGLRQRGKEGIEFARRAFAKDRS
jgi:hypothetical protein